MRRGRRCRRCGTPAPRRRRRSTTVNTATSTATRRAPPEVAVDAGHRSRSPRRCCGDLLWRRRRSRKASATTQTSRGAAKTSNWSPSSARAAMAGVRGRLCSSPSPVLVANGIATTAAAVRTTTGHAHRARIAAKISTSTGSDHRHRKQHDDRVDDERMDGEAGDERGHDQPFFGTACGPIVAPVPQRFLGISGGTKGELRSARRIGAPKAQGQRRAPHRRTDVAFTPGDNGFRPEDRVAPLVEADQVGQHLGAEPVGPTGGRVHHQLQDRVMRPRPVPAATRSRATAGRPGDVALHVVGEHLSADDTTATAPSGWAQAPRPRITSSR